MHAVLPRGTTASPFEKVAVLVFAHSVRASRERHEDPLLQSKASLTGMRTALKRPKTQEKTRKAPITRASVDCRSSSTAQPPERMPGKQTGWKTLSKQNTSGSHARNERLHRTRVEVRAGKRPERKRLGEDNKEQEQSNPAGQLLGGESPIVHKNDDNAHPRQLS